MHQHGNDFQWNSVYFYVLILNVGQLSSRTGAVVVVVVVVAIQAASKYMELEQLLCTTMQAGCRPTCGSSLSIPLPLS